MVRVALGSNLCISLLLHSGPAPHWTSTDVENANFEQHPINTEYNITNHFGFEESFLELQTHYVIGDLLLLGLRPLHPIIDHFVGVQTEVRHELDLPLIVLEPHENTIGVSRPQALSQSHTPIHPSRTIGVLHEL